MMRIKLPFRSALKAKALLLLAIYILGLVHNQTAKGQALPVAPVATFVMNRAVGQVITRVATARGFAANDPRILSTMTSVGSSLTAVNTVSTVAGVGLAVAGAPLWIGVAASLGVLAVGAAIVAGNASISVNSNKISVQQSSLTLSPYVAPSSVDTKTSQMLSRGIQIYRTPTCLSTDTYCSQFPSVPVSLVRPFVISSLTAIIVFRSLTDLDWSDNLSPVMPNPQFGETISYQHYWVPNADGTIQTLWRRATGLEYICSAASCSLQPFDRSYQRTDVAVDSSAMPLTSQNLDSIYPSISADTKAQSLSANTIAKIVDNAWRQAASQPGYQGLPYSLTNPVTDADVQPWIIANPLLVPKVGDLLSPAYDPLATPSPLAQPYAVPISPTVTTTVTTTTVLPSPVVTPAPTPSTTTTVSPTAATSPQDVNVVNIPTVKIDLGTDPAFQQPTVEPAPTASNILDPIFKLLPGWLNFQMPSLAGQCPTTTFDLNPVIPMTAKIYHHCQLIEQNRSFIKAFMVVAWTICAAFIVLGA